MEYSVDEIKPSVLEIPVVFQEANMLVKGSYRWRLAMAMPEMRRYVFDHCVLKCALCERLCVDGENIARHMARIRVNFAAGLN